MQTSNTTTKTEEKAEKRTAVILIIVIALLILIVTTAAGVFFMKNQTAGGNDPQSLVENYFNGLDIVTTDGTRLYIDEQPQTEEGQQLYNVLKDSWSYTVTNVDQSGSKATVTVNIKCPDLTSLPAVFTSAMNEHLKSVVSSAEKKTDIYNSDDTFKTELLESAYNNALTQDNLEIPKTEVQVTINLKKSLSGWSMLNEAEKTDTLDQHAQDIKSQAFGGVSYISPVYIIPEDTTVAPAPDQSRFGETTDPSVVSQLLLDKYAINLIKDETLLWSPERPFLSGTTMSYYLDESILMIEWQEEEAGMVGTFTEVFIADGSQFRRKIAGDSFGDMNFKTCSDFAKETNAVVAFGGDYYNHARNCGICVYNRDIYRLDYSTCDTCYITGDGDMLFSYRDQFSTPEEVQQFVADNNILWSLGFGPVLIDDGKDVTPDEYAWGEIDDTYARSALGMYGKGHYLVMNLNCGEGNLYNYATLRQAADAMIARGCNKAYTLDGGQTATTVVNGVLKNPVQFGNEKELSDIIYFATAVPNN